MVIEFTQQMGEKVREHMSKWHPYIAAQTIDIKPIILEVMNENLESWENYPTFIAVCAVVAQQGRLIPAIGWKMLTAPVRDQLRQRRVDDDNGFGWVVRLAAMQIVEKILQNPEREQEIQELIGQGVEIDQEAITYMSEGVERYLGRHYDKE